jgi:sterol desaturase/sphingolipid hydroxylase (fatty acid hydroxylase superfamily)
MDDSKYGSENARGQWKPADLIKYPDVFVWPPRIKGLVAWLPGYLFPWGVVYGVMAVLVWLLLTPSIERMSTLSLDWVALILVRNAGLLTLIVGLQHVWLYSRRSQDTAFKYNRTWPDRPNPTFTFKTQLKDNLFWTFAYGIPIWTAWESLALWAVANGWIGGVDPTVHPIWFAVIWFFVPLLHEFHFFWIHRLIHHPYLYKKVHKVHHRNINPGPWSGLSMHPVEHLIYFSGFLYYLVIPCHPIQILHHSLMVGISPAQGHTGFDRVVLGENKTLKLPYYAHYLHHRLFEVNYADGTIPLDKWFGSFHDGSPEADQALQSRRKNMAPKRSAQ